MSKTLGIIAAFTLAVTALLAFKNKEAYKEELANVEREAQRALSTQSELELEKARITSAEATAEGFNSQDETVKVELVEAADLISESKQELLTLEDDFNANEAKMVDTKSLLESLPNPEELVPKVTSMRTELAALNDDVAVRESKLANLVAKELGVTSEVTKVRSLIGLQSSGGSFPSMKTSISSVYPDLGFVVLNAGDKQGVVSGSILDVLRGGEVIGKLKVTAVEAGRSTANIVLDSVASGKHLHSGDVVVAEKKNSVASVQ